MTRTLPSSLFAIERARARIGDQLRKWLERLAVALCLAALMPAGQVVAQNAADWGSGLAPPFVPKMPDTCAARVPCGSNADGSTMWCTYSVKC